MDNYSDKGDARTQGDGEGQDDTVARLMKLAGPRASIPAGVETRVHQRVEQEWLSSLPGNSSRRWAVSLALAASIVLAVIVTMRPTDAPSQTIGTIGRVVGGPAVTVGQAVHVGDTLQVDAGQGIGVTLPGVLSLRIDGNSSLRFDGPDEFTLLSGQVYADSGRQIYRRRNITIHTPFGSVKDIGTQFAVDVDDDDIVVSVREGRVDIATDQQSHTAIAGEKISLKANEKVVVDQIPANDESWEWAEALAPGFDSNNRSLLDFLKWAARETGKELYFTSNEVRMAAMKAKLYGPVLDFTPQEATEAVLSTTTFVYQIDDHRITIGK